MVAEISQRMFSEIMPAFTEMTEMFIMKTKNSEKRALFSIKYSRSALSIVDKIENWKNTKKKTTSIDEKEKVEVKLHAALVLNMTYWVIYEPRRDTQRSGGGKGFNDRVSLRRNPLGVWVAPGQKSHNALHFYLWNETKRKRDSWFVKETQK